MKYLIPRTILWTRAAWVSWPCGNGSLAKERTHFLVLDRHHLCVSTHTLDLSVFPGIQNRNLTPTKPQTQDGLTGSVWLEIRFVNLAIHFGLVALAWILLRPGLHWAALREYPFKIEICFRLGLIGLRETGPKSLKKIVFSVVNFEILRLIMLTSHSQDPRKK